MNDLLFQYCQKIIVFNADFTEILLAKRQNEQDYDGVYTFIGGKLERSDGGFIEGLRREKNEEIGANATIEVLPDVTYNLYFKKKDGNHMILPHYIARYTGGNIIINEEYSEYKWVKLDVLADFGPKIDNIPFMVGWANKAIGLFDSDSWVIL